MSDKAQVTIYVWPKRIKRQGKTVNGYQASFSKPPGGVTCESREDAVAHMREVADRNDMEVVDVIEVE